MMESEPEALTLGLGELEVLTEGHCEGVCVAQCVGVPLRMPLPLRLPEGDAEAVPRLPGTPAPPEEVGECETVAVTLTLGEAELLTEGHCEGVCVALCEALLL